MVEKKDKAVLNLANGLSIARMILAPIFMLTVFNGHYKAAFIIILVATLTDFLDGHIARIWKMQTRLGKMLDPLADKIIILFAIVTLLIKFNFPLWIGLIIITRDIILLSGTITFLYKHRKKVLIPNFLGKVTAFLQMTIIVAYIPDIMINISPIIKNILLFLVVLSTLASAVVYFIKGYSLFFGNRKHEPMINLPNKITIFRIIFIPIFIAFLLSNIPFREIVAASIFIVLALSDALDGYIARKRKQITDFGKLIDPLADKLLVSAALIFLIGKGIEPWMAYAILAREFLITGLRMVALTKNQAIPARISGKIKTVTQVIAITAVLLQLNFSWHLMVIAVLITIYSGIEYIWTARHTFKELI